MVRRDLPRQRSMQLVQLIARQPFGHVCQKTGIGFGSPSIMAWNHGDPTRVWSQRRRPAKPLANYIGIGSYRARGPEAERDPNIIWRAFNLRRVAAASASMECKVADFATLKVVASEIEC